MTETDQTVEGEVISTAVALRTPQDIAAYQRAHVAEQIALQSRLSWMKKRELIPGAAAATKEAVKLIDNIVQLTGIPYHLISLIPQNKGAGAQPYINAEGWFLKARCDERGIADVDSSDVTVDETNQSVQARCTLTLGTGQKFRSMVYKRLSEERKGQTMSAMVAKAITQARGKAAYMAVGYMFPGVLAEEMDQLAPEASVSVVKPTGLANTAQLLGRAKRELGLNMAAVLKSLEVTNLGMITDFDAAWEKLQSAK